jgi:DNA polymerase-1
MLLVDGLAVAYRAFHAIPHLSSAKGEPTNALFGFIKMLRQLEEQWHPTHRAVVFDGGLPAQRMALWPAYKAQREPMPEALRAQLEPINTFLQLAGWCSVRPPEEEADDALATLAVKAAGPEMRVLIASSDKDLLQLVTDHIQIVPPTKDGLPLDAAAVRLKFGVAPAQVVDALALIGDAADNIPGVPGIGPKTAAQVLAQCTRLDEVWNQLERVESERIRHLLADHRAVVERNQALMRLRIDLPDMPPVDQLRARRPDYGPLVEFLEERDLKGLARSYRETELELF